MKPEQLFTTVIYRDVDHFTKEQLGPDRAFIIDVWTLPTDTPLQKCERIWRAMNVVDGTEIPARMGIRSMMVGDQVKFDKNLYEVASIGWTDANTGEHLD